MSYLRPLQLISLLLVLVCSCFSQRIYNGKVVDVIDAKTVVIETETGRLTAEMQYIEVPDSEHPFYKTVNDHLKELVLGKKVEFRLQGFSSVKFTGRLYLGDLDIAQQMLRDGAAWHIPAQKSSQDTIGFNEYSALEGAAKNEKRGVWSLSISRPTGIVSSDGRDQLTLHKQTAAVGNDVFFYASEGSRFYLARDYQRAIRSYTKVLELEKKTRKLPTSIWLVVVDNLAMAYGISGDVQMSMGVLEYGLSVEPTYPMFHYNMACGFGEQNDEAGALKYLRLAFQYKDNMIPGERFPNPATDSSFERLMKKDSFKKAVSNMKNRK